MRLLTLTTAALLTAAPLLRGDDRTPPPDADAQAKAETQIKERFKQDFAKHKPADMQELASKLIQQAAQERAEQHGGDQNDQHRDLDKVDGLAVDHRLVERDDVGDPPADAGGDRRPGEEARGLRLHRLGHRLHGADESLHLIFVGGKLRLKDLESDGMAGLGIGRLEDGAGGAAGDDGVNLEMQ